MNAAMMDRWNEVVRQDDDVWHLGDFALRMPVTGAGDLLASLNGRKHLVIGNNDPPAVVALPGWTSVQHYKELEVESTRLVLCHYAFRSWNGMGRGVLNLHGHSHGRLKKMPRQIDVGVDVWNFRPITTAELLATPETRARSGARLATP